MSLFLKTLILSFSLEGGLIPGGPTLTLYTIYNGKTSINTNINTYSDMRFTLDFGKYFYVFGGMISYQWPKRGEVNFYPFRLDYQIGAGAKYKSIEIGIGRYCDHGLMPNADLTALVHGEEFSKLDIGYFKIFAKVEIKKQLFN